MNIQQLIIKYEKKLESAEWYLRFHKHKTVGKAEIANLEEIIADLKNLNEAIVRKPHPEYNRCTECGNTENPCECTE